MTNELIIITPEQAAANALADAMAVVTQAKTVIVKDDASYHAADEACGAIKAAMKRADAERDGWVRPLNTQVKRINAGFKDIENAYNAALSAYRIPMTAYQAKLADERRKVEAEAEAERKRQQAIKDEEQRKARLEFERAQKEADDARISAAAANIELDPFEAALAEGNTMEPTNNATTEAQRLAEAATNAREVYEQSIRDSRVEVAVAYVPKVTGSGSKTFIEWRYEITDPAAVPGMYRPINESMIAAEVKVSKGETAIPGVRVFSDVVVK